MIDLFGVETAAAALSPCEQCPGELREDCTDFAHRPYRYQLMRLWDPELPRALWVMLNPSTADGRVDDPTIRKCIGFTKRWGYGGFTVCNLFAWRSPNPELLVHQLDPIGPHNDENVKLAASECDQAIVAWGAHRLARKRSAEVTGMLRNLGIELNCLGMMKAGQPKHPLLVPYSVRRIRYAIDHG